MKTVSPSDARVLAVGGVTAMNAGIFRTCGADGLGVGSSMFNAGKSLAALANDVRAIIESWVQAADG